MASENLEHFLKIANWIEEAESHHVVNRIELAEKIIVELLPHYIINSNSKDESLDQSIGEYRRMFGVDLAPL